MSGVLDSFKLHYEDMPLKKSLRGRHNKSLTIKNNKRIMKSTIKRKDGKMAKVRKLKLPKFINSTRILKTFAWLLFAVQQAYMGWLLLDKGGSYLSNVAALTSLGIAGAVVAAHFFKAHK